MFHRKKPHTASPNATAAPPTTAVPTELVSLVKTAGISLTKAGIPAGQRAAVYLVIDRSYSMKAYYANGSVQKLADQVLAMSANLDDDGTVPLIMFDSQPYPTVDISLDHYHGAVAQQHQLHGGEHSMGGTQYTIAMRAVIAHYLDARTTDPALVIFQTDGEPQDHDAARLQLAQASKLPIFWSFVGFGRNEVDFLKQLDSMGGRLVDNASYFHAGALPSTLPDRDLYDGITRELGSWLTAARDKGLLP
ncbi:VWA domain-containing protein [Streptomyces beihaiensis]|uniref:VWA domain-containing protein n=1 Tax=Streptomyces beihaiensis TaxID=2984495 RepID=A0ABT3TRG6_9ACTN|nr:VWA domain-containing protein [Streptomyces beihaiensis]MCX3059597.1 VWA domain-containing protein [Streptomyces beihaiensis]